MQTPLEKLRQRTFLKFYAGVHDGEKDLIVPISHSIRMYNKILKDEGIKDANKYVPRSDMTYMLQNFAAPRQQQLGKLQGGQEIVYRKNTGLVSLVIFDGGHDIDFDQVFADLQKDVVKRNE